MVNEREREQEGRINGKIESFNGIDFFFPYFDLALTMETFYFSFFLSFLFFTQSQKEICCPLS